MGNRPGQNRGFILMKPEITHISKLEQAHKPKQEVFHIKKKKVKPKKEKVEILRSIQPNT